MNADSFCKVFWGGLFMALLIGQLRNDKKQDEREEG